MATASGATAGVNGGLVRADSAVSTSSRRSNETKHQEELIQSLEAEEERLTNALTRKLEKLRAEKVELENVLEAESESLVLRLQRQLSELMRQQQSQQAAAASQPASQARSQPISPVEGPPAPNLSTLISGADPLQPSNDTLIQALKSENSTLRHRLVDTEREYIKTSRQNDAYRSELIALRQRSGIAIEDLVSTSGSLLDEGPPPPSTARRWARTHSTSSTTGIPIPGSLQRRGFGSSSPGSPSVSFGQVSSSLSLPSSIPISPSTDGSPRLESARDTTLTTPSTSYPGLPVPFSTPVASPYAGQRSYYPSGTPSSVQVPPPPPPSVVRPNLDLPPSSYDSSVDDPDSANATPLSQSPSSRSGSLSRRPSAAGRGRARVAETGTLKPRRSRGGSIGGPSADAKQP